MMRYTVFFLSLLIGMMLTPAYAWGAEKDKSIKLYMNQKLLVSDEVSPRIVEGNTIVPVRIIAEELGAKVSWNEEAKRVTIVKDSMNIQLTINSKVALIQGAKQNMEVPPVIENGNTMLPLRFIGEQMGVKFNWDYMTSSVYMVKDDEPVSVPVMAPIEEDEEEEADPSSAVVSVNTQPSSDKGNTDKTNSGSNSSDKQGAATSTTNKPSTTTNTTSTTSNSPSTSSADKSNSSTTKPTTTATPTSSNSGNTGKTTNASSVSTDKDTDKTLQDSKTHVLTSIELTDKNLTVKAKDGELKPTVIKLSDPGRIVFDFPGTVLDDALAKKMVNNIGEIASKHPKVAKIRYSKFSDDPQTVRVILDLKGIADYRELPSKQSNIWTAAIEEKHLRVVIDAGHGGKDPGAQSVTNKNEKDFTLTMANKVTALLAKDEQIEVIETRSTDVFVELDDRVAIANNIQADLFLSIHGNKHTKPTISGTETYYYNPQSLDFANTVHKHIIPAAGLPDRDVRIGDFRVIHKTTMPAVLVEVGYLSNKTDEAAMYTEAFQNQVAASLVSAIEEYLNIK
ncbi:N-acetylmuramoyl-L-alanine amidase family protein [Paenibacillus hexagrammi]|uniref:N-acetylmuramoyl-L-alanine amidase family protein n=1 Tax=Paenibacillus hexagrammi TaxID=2908839 RepID=A0ABY3SQ56_9BACL|nr:N-acetylmuramoyl-L-alanine amidase family protein [Paenibacillus sp. YPD9-1]UJF36119.1 N-acetylmuramoyl-L-alanine amidase family protein [Paenibacillus sp. YPD9-1]